MRTLILGASGLIGGNLLKHLRDEEAWHVIGTHFSFETQDTVFYNTLNPQDKENEEILAFNAEVVVHCGALTWVDYCEENEEESWQKTVLSTKNALELAKLSNARFVYLSTDYVFDGRYGPYTENANENPLSVYGKHKLEAEGLVKDSGLPHIICRVTNVYGDEIRGKNFISRLIELAKSGDEAEMNFPSDQYATPVNAYDVARAIKMLLQEELTGIYNIAGTDYVNRYQLAEMVLKHFPGHNISTRPIETKVLNQKAERPLNGGLLSAKLLSRFPDFKFSNVDDYVRNKS